MRLKAIAMLAMTAGASAAIAQAPQPAPQTIERQLQCIVDGADAPLRDTIGRVVVAEATGGPAEDAGASYERLGTVAVLCKARHGWSDAAVEAAIGWAVARFTMVPAETLLRANGIDPAAVRASFRALTAEQRKAFLLDPIPDAVVEALLERMAASGQPVETAKAGESVGLLAGMLAMADDSAARVAAR